MQMNELISKRIRNLIKERNWTNYHLARRAGIPCSTLYYALGAKGETIKMTTLLNICRGFEITINDFFDDEMFELENIADD